MMIFGMLGYLCRKFDLNTAAIVLALILDPIGEKNLRRSLGALRWRPGDPVLYACVLIALCVFGILSPIVMNRMEKNAVEQAGSDMPGETGDDPVRTSD